MSPASLRGAERRLRTRFRVQLPFILKDNEHEIHGATRNISLLGISAYTDAPLGISQPVHCFLKLPKASQPIVASGTIIYCEPLAEPHPEGGYETGVFFKEFQNKGESGLASFLEQVRQNEQKAIKVGYIAFQKRLAERRLRKRLKALRQKQRKRARLLRKKRLLQKQKRKRALHRKKQARQRTGRSTGRKTAHN